MKEVQNYRNNWLTIIGCCVISMAGYGFIGYHLPRTEVGKLLLAFGILFLMYGLIIGQQWSNVWIKRWLGVAIGFRIILLFSTPALSDDYFRFIWDGRLLAAGYNPYLYLPTDLLPSPVASKAHLTQQLFDGLNSPHYFTVYPSLNQLLFAASAWLSGGNVIWNIVLLRLWIILAEIGTIGLMIRFLPKVLKIPKNTQAPIIYALNPLVIVELTGNLHFEAVTIFFVLLAVGVFLKPFQNDKFSLASAVALALAVAVKLLPMLFLPLLLKRLGFWRWVVYCGAVGGVLLLFFAPFLSRELFLNFGKSLDLYFQKFEFNASIYYLLREVGYWLTGYNVIQTLGPLLSSITVVGVVWIAHRSGSLVHKMLLALTLYFLLATTVHPWYITTLVAFGALAGRWYPIVWSVLLPLTYVAYTYQPYHENLNLVVLEYVLVIGCLVYEEIK